MGIKGWRKRAVRGLVLGPVLVAVSLVSGCYAGGQANQDNPAARKLTWFSYVKGEDLKAGCTTGAPDRYRFVYNAVYVEQVRTYDVEPSPIAGQTRITARVTDKANLANLEIDPRDLDLFGPWRPAKAVIDLPNSDADMLKRAVLSDGLMTKAAPKRAVTSIEFYWAASACIDGQFHLNAWVWPGEDFDRASFPKLLLGWDMTGVAVNPPRKTDEFSVYGAMQPDKGPEFANYFRLRFDES
jgi:hypothetical protein